MAEGPPTIDIVYERVFPYPRDVAFAWLTDYQDDDPTRTDRVVLRRDVVSREPGRVVVDVHVETVGAWLGRSEILIFPPDRWQARPLPPKSATVFEYSLAPDPAGARLRVVYRLAVRRPWKRLVTKALRPLVRRKIARMWDGFAAAMERELGPERRVAAPAR